MQMTQTVHLSGDRAWAQKGEKGKRVVSLGSEEKQPGNRRMPADSSNDTGFRLGGEKRSGKAIVRGQ